ncbi:MAG TPA: hypothetical protein VJM31_09730 [Vicinamibacterales bacterium]|nr:hypothetical protein [Vicinamibacterales bacterium]
MLRLLATVLAEVVVGLTIGGIVLALAIPALHHYGLIATGDLAGAIVITLVLVATIGAMMFRPNSAMNRYFRR